MKEHFNTILFGFLTAFAVVVFTMPSLIKVARMKHLVDEPSEARKLHQRSVPTIGGIIIFAAIIFSYALYFPTEWSAQFKDIDQVRGMFNAFSRATADFKYVLAAMVLLFFIGVKDDIVGFSPVKKLVGHFVVGSILVLLADIRIHSLHGIFGVYYLPYSVSVLFTFFVYVVLVNAFNLIDGVDGLAGGVGLIAALAFGTWLYLCGLDMGITLLAFVLAGALLGFLVFNYHPARVFMGDSGSLIVGAILAVLAIEVVDHDKRHLPVQLENLSRPIFVMAVLAYPLVDTLRVFVVRMARGTSPFTADRNHIHHRLLELGLGHRGATALIYLYVLVIIALSLVTRKWHPNIGLMVLGTTAFAIAMLPFVWPKRRSA
ncbi:MAG: undecaprenyl/decaprenyl-phosphate alpha-N-acetylglucosaminyl 1-phosphate transferase [Flavobacteriales bacterium]|nr:undecaprenyl/decaprenyl-phosphate alpha-N-acetylglucosaminyl 1-phosphate transferase [Flavobacteriales bacterium]